MSDNENELVDKARNGDRESLEQLLMEHSNQLRSHLLRGLPARVKGVISVDDVVQEALTQAFRKIERLRGSSQRAFAAWLYAIGDMTLIDMVRKETAQVRGGKFRRQVAAGSSESGSLVSLLGQLPDDGATASRMMARKEGVGALQVALAGLPSDQRQALQLHVLRGMSLQETADEMQRTTASVRSLIHRAKQNLAVAMGRASQWLSRRS